MEALTRSLNSNSQVLLKARLKGLISVFPFNEYEYMLMFLLNKSIITFKEYEELREDYVSTNRYLDLYGLAPRIFGEMWHQHIMDLDNRFRRPDKGLDPDYEGQYDLWIDGVRVEVKACRATKTREKGSLVSKALAYESDEPFWMNFQQIKLDVADVFIFVGVWTDRMIYWIMSSEEVKINTYLSHQHRGGIEYQIGVTEKNIEEFDVYIVEPKMLGDQVVKKG